MIKKQANYTNYIGLALILSKTIRIMEEYTTTIKTTENLWKISNDLDSLIKSLVFGQGKNGKYIKIVQGILKRLDKEIENLD